MVDRYKTYNGVRRWRVRITIPTSNVANEAYIDHIKRGLKLQCIEQYLDVAKDSFTYHMTTQVGDSNITEMTLEMDDLFSLREENKALSRQVSELIDLVTILKGNQK